MKSNDVILHTLTKVAIFVIFTFAIDLFLSGHHEPGGGFIGGLAIASGIVLFYLSFGSERVSKNLPLNFIKVAASGVAIAVLTGMIGLLSSDPFLTHRIYEVDLLIFGPTEITTALLFDTGVALAVVGTAVHIILTISEDRE